MATVAATAPAPAGTPTGPALNHSHPFTCVTCAIAFRSSKMQRDHMRSDWHRYNLKRRVASLPPLSSEIFAEKVITAQASSSAAAAKASFEKTCAACQKTYYSENAYQNHLGSQRHRAKAAAMGKDTDKESEPPTPSIISSTISLGDPIMPAPENVEDPEVEAEFTEVVKGIKNSNAQKDSSENDDEDRRPSRPHHSSNDGIISHPISPVDTPSSSAATNTSTVMPLSRCLFCNYDSPTFKLSLLHMYKFHAMFIPEQDYLSDLEGLIRYLQAKITENYECLFCHKLKTSASAVQTHMRDKGHTMIAFDSEEEMLEIGQFYDFRSTYSDYDSDSDAGSDSTTNAKNSKSKASKASKLGARRGNTDDGTDDDDEDNDEAWETDSDFSVDSDEIGSVPLGKDHEYRQAALARYRRDPRSLPGDGMHSRSYDRHAAYRDGHELHLPSGRTVGHRSLARYYRQNLRDRPSQEERAEQQQRLLESGESTENQEQGQRNNRQVVSRNALGMLGVSDATRRHVAAIAQKQTRKAQRNEDQYRWRVQRRANNQKHFRDDNYGIRL